MNSLNSLNSKNSDSVDSESNSYDIETEHRNIAFDTFSFNNDSTNQLNLLEKDKSNNKISTCSIASLSTENISDRYTKQEIKSGIVNDDLNYSMLSIKLNQNNENKLFDDQDNNSTKLLSVKKNLKKSYKKMKCSTINNISENTSKLKINI